jgi:Domain of unknown function (DUF932)
MLDQLNAARGAACENVATPDQVPLYSLVPLRGLDGQPLEAYRGVQRADTHEVISVVSDRYGLVQHRAVAEAVYSVGDALGLPGTDPEAPAFPRERIRLYAGGKRLEVKLVVGQRFKLGEGESFYPGLRVLNSLDGSWAVRCESYAVRLACANQLYAGNGVLGEFRELHLASQTDLLGQVHKAIRELLDRFEGALGLYSRAMGKEMLAGDVEPALVERGLPRVHASVIGGRVEAGASHNTLVSCWTAYNEATAYLSHEVRVNPDRERQFERAAAGALLVPGWGRSL